MGCPTPLFIARTKGGSVSWVTRMWEGQRHPLETENDIKINLLLFIFTEKESSVLHHHRNWRVLVEELSNMTSNSQSLVPQQYFDSSLAFRDLRSFFIRMMKTELYYRKRFKLNSSNSISSHLSKLHAIRCKKFTAIQNSAT